MGNWLKIEVLVAVCLIPLFIVPSISYADEISELLERLENPESFEPKQSEGFYKNESHEFSFNMPTSWVYHENYGGDEYFLPWQVLTFPPIDDFPSIGVTYDFVSSSEVPVLNERNVENYVIEYLTPTLPEGRITSSSVESKSWGYVISTEYFDAEYFLEMKSYFFKNGDLYRVEYASTQTNFDAYHHEYEKVLDSLVIKDTKVNASFDGGGCLIATATFGSELSPQVQMLREIRDNSLLQTQSGKSFMEGFNAFYYSFSPTIADYERQNPIFKETVKLTITPLLASLSLLNYVDLDSEESVLGYGIGIILMNVGMYFVAPVIVIHRIKKILNS